MMWDDHREKKLDQWYIGNCRDLVPVLSGELTLWSWITRCHQSFHAEIFMGNLGIW